MCVKAEVYLPEFSCWNPVLNGALEKIHHTICTRSHVSVRVHVTFAVIHRSENWAERVKEKERLYHKNVFTQNIWHWAEQYWLFSLACLSQYQGGQIYRLFSCNLSAVGISFHSYKERLIFINFCVWNFVVFVCVCICVMLFTCFHSIFRVFWTS